MLGVRSQPSHVEHKTWKATKQHYSPRYTCSYTYITNDTTTKPLSTVLHVVWLTGFSSTPLQFHPYTILQHYIQSGLIPLENAHLCWGSTLYRTSRNVALCLLYFSLVQTSFRFHTLYTVPLKLCQDLALCFPEIISIKRKAKTTTFPSVKNQWHCMS